MRRNDTARIEHRTARQELFDTLREKASKLDETSFRKCLAHTPDSSPQRYGHVRRWIESRSVEDMLKLNLSEFLNLLDVTRSLEELYSYKRKALGIKSFMETSIQTGDKIKEMELAKALKLRAQAVGHDKIAEKLGVARSTLYKALVGDMSNKTRAKVMLYLKFGDLIDIASKASKAEIEKARQEHEAAPSFKREKKGAEEPQKPLDDLKDFI